MNHSYGKVTIVEGESSWVGGMEGGIDDEPIDYLFDDYFPNCSERICFNMIKFGKVFSIGYSLTYFRRKNSENVRQLQNVLKGQFLDKVGVWIDLH